MSENNMNLPIHQEVLVQLSHCDEKQLAWLSGYCWARAQQHTLPAKSESGENALLATPHPALRICILSASQTGNARTIAQQLADKLQNLNVEVNLIGAGDYKPRNIAKEELLFLVTSTQGEGEVPEEALPLWRFLCGKKAPQLISLGYAILGLGDSSYTHFCQAGKDFDAKFQALGAKALVPRYDADADFTQTAQDWINAVYAWVQENAPTSEVLEKTTLKANVQDNGLVNAPLYTKTAPFAAMLLTRQKITGDLSHKDIRHIEFDLTDSGIRYQPGDSLGVLVQNDPALVDEFLQLFVLEATLPIHLGDETLSLEKALTSRLELTQNNTALIEKYAQWAKNAQLTELVEQKDQLQALAQRTPIIDFLQTYPSALTAQQLVSLLRPLTPRFYSIASSQDEVSDEVHITVAVVRFEHNGKLRGGVASTYLADRLEEDDSASIFVESNPYFRLPRDPNTPVIMIGSGTGIAPYRAFVQQRAHDQAPGKNWLIFGNPHFIEDFLYQTEWQAFAKEGYLHRTSFAWSRDQEEKVYVQDKIREEATTLWQWLQEGAHLYVCGDAATMAKGVEQALVWVIQTQGQLDAQQAQEYLDELRVAKRYQRDVY